LHLWEERDEMRVNGELLLVVVLIGVFGGALFMAKNWPIQTSLFPIFMGGVGLSLAITQLTITVVKGKEDSPRGAGKVQSNMKNELTAFGWILAFFVATALLGFQWGLAGIIFLYLKFEGKESLALSISLAVVGWGIIYALKAFLHLPLYGGFLVEWFRVG
jgi:hypothetical protein